MTITPIDISVKTRYTTEMKAPIAKANTPITQYLDKYSLPGYMWDEIAGIALDRSIDYHGAEKTVYGYRHRSWRELRKDAVLGCVSSRPTL